MFLSPYLTFNGQCEEAFRFYEKCLGGKIEALISYTGTPAEEHVPEEWRSKIIHARLTVGNTVLMASDAPPDRFREPIGFSVSLQVKEPEETERVFHALAEGGNITMPIEKTFWSQRFGMLVDKFGIPWMVNCEEAA